MVLELKTPSFTEKTVAWELLFFSSFWTKINDYFECREGRQKGVGIEFAWMRSESGIAEKSLLIAIDLRAAKRGLNHVSESS
jgi:hypothetical protein